MSDAIDQGGCFRHRAHVRYFTIYDDFQDIGKGHHLPDPTQDQPEEDKNLIEEIKRGKHADKIAAFLRILEVKTNRKIITYQVLAEEAEKNGTPAPKLNLWIEMTYADFINWSLETVGRSSFQIADKAAELLLFSKSRVLKRPPNPAKPDAKRDYKEYLLVMENVQAALDQKELPITDKKLEDYDTPVFFNSTPRHPLFFSTAPADEKNSTLLTKKTAPAVENSRNVSNSKSNGLNERRKEGSTLPASAATTYSPSEKEKQIIQWFCEIANCQVEQITITPAAQRSLKAISLDVEAKKDVQDLYERAKQIIINSNKPNQTVFIANLKDGLLGLKQNKAVAPTSTSEASPGSDPGELVLWSRYVESSDFKLDKEAWYLYEWMPRSEAEQYDYAGMGPLNKPKQAAIMRCFDQEKNGSLQRPAAL